MSYPHTFGQVLVALVTPMTNDGEVDWDGVAKQVDTCVSQGADGIVVTATTGETVTLTDDEKIKLVEVAHDAAAGRAAITMGGASNETAHAVQLVKRAERAGADALLAVTPYYIRPTQAGVLEHFRRIADATDLPVMLYDIPGRTGTAISYETLVAASKHPNIRAVKDAKGDFAQVAHVLATTPLEYYSGDDSNVLGHLVLGGTGVVSVTANIATAPYRKMIDAADADDFAEALVYYRDLEPLVRATMSHIPGTVAAKYILHGLGRISSPRVRLPLVGPDEAEAAYIEADVAEVDSIPGVDFTDFSPDRNAAAGGALPQISGTARQNAHD